MDTGQIILTSVCAFTVAAMAVVIWITYRVSAGRPIFKPVIGPPRKGYIIVTRGCLLPSMLFLALASLVMRLSLPSTLMNAILGLGGLGIVCLSIVLAVRGIRAVSGAQPSASSRQITMDAPRETATLASGSEKSREMIADALRRIQEEGGEGNFVVFKADQERNYYAQFAAKGQTALYAEAVSNHFLSPEHALSNEQIARLESMGWDHQEGSNYYRHWEAGSDEERSGIAQEVIRAFVEVYGMSPDDPIKTELVLE